MTTVELIELDWSITKEDGSGVGGVLQQELVELSAANVTRRMQSIVAHTLQRRTHTASFV
jgi:hypothetical protein